MNPTKSFSILFLLLSALVISAPQAIARAPLTYSPPSQISVWMYWLTAGGARREPYTLCASGSTRWGCTAFCDEPGYPCERSQTLAYPYAANPTTIPIETDYLLDVVPREMGTYYHPIALQAQAIAARSYAYWHINQGSSVNNSNQFQVFVPYYFESLPPTTQVTPAPVATSTPISGSSAGLSPRATTSPTAPTLTMTCPLSPSSPPTFGVEPWPGVNPI